MTAAGGEMSDHLTADQLAEITEAVKHRESWTPSGMHINYGESQDYMAGWSAGYDRADDGKKINEERLPMMAPEQEPNRSAFIRGYREGWQFFHDGDESDAARPTDASAG